MVVCPPTRLEKLHLMQFIHYPLHHPHRGSLQQTYDDYYGRKDWPSHGYPLDDDGPDYDADDRGQHQSCQPVPLRYGFYLLAKEYGKASIQHPIAQDLAFYDCPELRRKLYSGLVTMLRMIREVSENDPTSEGLNADRELGNICLTIPAQWDSSFQKVYLDALAAAFDYQPETLREKVMFITEPDALVHVIYGCLTHKPTPMNRQPQIELFLNFGTHTTVCSTPANIILLTVLTRSYSSQDGSMFWVGPQEVNGPTTVRTRFFRMGDPFGKT